MTTAAEIRLALAAVQSASFFKTGPAQRQKLFDFYLANLRWVNNWDLVDTSAPQIVGHHLLTRKRTILYKLAKSKDLGERRIAIVATQTLIRAGDTKDTYAIAALLFNDKKDLIHKATGWMLREAGIHSRTALLEFLKQHYKNISRRNNGNRSSADISISLVPAKPLGSTLVASLSPSP